jgi:myosin heavy subunit
MTHKLNDLWWIPDDKEVWTLATQSSAELPNGCINFLVQKTQKMVAYQREKCLPASNALNTPEDLVFLHDVNQATILACTRSRFNEHKIYTNMGQVLMSVNPFEKIPGLYGKNVIDEFKNPDTKSFAAHVYSIPARAYTNMCMTGGNQSILISGESGAGTFFSLTDLTNVINSVYFQR